MQIRFDWPDFSRITPEIWGFLGLSFILSMVINYLVHYKKI